LVSTQRRDSTAMALALLEQRAAQGGQRRYKIQDMGRRLLEHDFDHAHQREYCGGLVIQNEIQELTVALDELREDTAHDLQELVGMVPCSVDRYNRRQTAHEEQEEDVYDFGRKAMAMGRIRKQATVNQALGEQLRINIDKLLEDAEAAKTANEPVAVKPREHKSKWEHTAKERDHHHKSSSMKKQLRDYHNHKKRHDRHHHKKNSRSKPKPTLADHLNNMDIGIASDHESAATRTTSNTTTEEKGESFTPTKIQPPPVVRSAMDFPEHVQVLTQPTNNSSLTKDNQSLFSRAIIGKPKKPAEEMVSKKHKMTIPRKHSSQHKDKKDRVEEKKVQEGRDDKERGKRHEEKDKRHKEKDKHHQHHHRSSRRGYETDTALDSHVGKDKEKHHHRKGGYETDTAAAPRQDNDKHHHRSSRKVGEEKHHRKSSKGNESETVSILPSSSALDKYYSHPRGVKSYEADAIATVTSCQYSRCSTRKMELMESLIEKEETTSYSQEQEKKERVSQRIQRMAPLINIVGPADDECEDSLMAAQFFNECENSMIAAPGAVDQCESNSMIVPRNSTMVTYDNSILDNGKKELDNSMVVPRSSTLVTYDNSILDCGKKEFDSGKKELDKTKEGKNKPSNRQSSKKDAGRKNQKDVGRKSQKDNGTKTSEISIKKKKAISDSKMLIKKTKEKLSEERKKATLEGTKKEVEEKLIWQRQNAAKQAEMMIAEGFKSAFSLFSVNPKPEDNLNKANVKTGAEEDEDMSTLALPQVPINGSGTFEEDSLDDGGPILNDFTMDISLPSKCFNGSVTHEEKMGGVHQPLHQESFIPIRSGELSSSTYTTK